MWAKPALKSMHPEGAIQKKSARRQHTVAPDELRFWPTATKEAVARASLDRSAACHRLARPRRHAGTRSGEKLRRDDGLPRIRRRALETDGTVRPPAGYHLPRRQLR